MSKDRTGLFYWATLLAKDFIKNLMKIQDPKVFFFETYWWNFNLTDIELNKSQICSSEESYREVNKGLEGRQIWIQIWPLMDSYWVLSRSQGILLKNKAWLVARNCRVCIQFFMNWNYVFSTTSLISLWEILLPLLPLKLHFFPTSHDHMTAK